MDSLNLLIAALGLLAVGAVVIAVFGRQWRTAGYMAVAFTAVAAVALWVLAAKAFTSGALNTNALVNLSPLGASLTFHVDRLSAVFLIFIPFVSLTSVLYAVGYMRKVYPQCPPARYYSFALLLTAAMVGVVTSSDLLFFFIFWELMTLTSWVLVWFDREDEVKVRAAWLYFVVIHVASGCMLIAAVVVYGWSGSFAFTDVSRAISDMLRTSPALVHVLAALFFIAFVTKAGMFPVGGWLPEAHPAAPVPASAVFSGAMIKTGIYALIRLFFEFIPPGHATMVWGGIIAALGATSILVGTTTALRQDDAKRVLSFHSIGQIGYMVLAVGTSIFFAHTNPTISAIALIAGIYHVVNHSCYKSLLFLNAGAAEYATGTRDLNKMGGLGAIMPLTMATAVIASLSIAGIPPFNGFASKWLIYQSTIQGGIGVPAFLLLAVVAIFVSLVTLASFMKMLGAMFLGKPASDPGESGGDVPAAMRIPQVALAAGCVLLGVVPLLPLLLLHGAAQDVAGASVVPSYHTLFGTNPYGITLGSGGPITGVWNPAYMVLATIICVIGVYAFSRLAGAGSRETATWYGGEEALPNDVRYRAHGFVLPFKNVFAKVYPSIPVPRIEALRGIRKILDFDRWLYNPIVKAAGSFTDRLSRTHSGIPQLYMIWQLVGVVIVLAVLFALFR